MWTSITLLILALSATALNKPPKGLDHSRSTPTRHIPGFQKRDGTTGCTCYGLQSTIDGLNNGLNEWILYPQNGNQDITTNNLVGWCFEDNLMTATSQDRVENAITSQTDTDYTNGPWSQDYCNANGCPEGTCDCAQFIISLFTNDIVNLYPDIFLTDCTGEYPVTTDNFEPVDCDCGFICTNGFQPCGTTECYDPNTQTCSSGTPVNTRRRREAVCPTGFEMCQARRGFGWECLDTNSHLEACGGCPDGDGVDCTAIAGAGSVKCVAGQCQVTSCDKGFVMVKRKCVPQMAKVRFQW